ncbi:hypothetical protein ACLOJK_009199 [Asimina triloba]
MGVELFLLFLVLGPALVALLHSLFAKQELGGIPNGSMGWPLLGETLGLLKPHTSNTLGSFLKVHCSRYGNVFKSHVFGSPTIISCDQELNSFILQNEERLFECSYPKAIHGVLGKLSMLVVVGDAHKKLRSIALGLTNMWKWKLEYLHDIEEQAISTLESWKNRETIVFCEEARKYTFNVIVKQILSKRPEEPQTAKILEDFLTFMKGLVSFPLYIPGAPYAKAVKARARICSTVRAIVDERRKGGVVVSEKGDFLDVLLANASLSDEEIVSLVLDLLLGGYETTSLLMSLVVYFLGGQPTALAKLKEEHETISKRKKGEQLNWEDYKQMGFTQKVINEALRCGNIVKFVHRKALKDVQFKGNVAIAGYVIPSGWKVLPVFSAVHLDPSVHENPSEFCPRRWEGRATSRKMTPFGGGPRLCPGADLAKVETAFFLHHLVLKFRWRIQQEDQPMAYPYVEFKRGLPIEIEPM